MTHLNNDMNRINRRVVKAQMKQITEMMPDVPAPPVSDDITINYTALMKSLSNILINLQEVYMSRFQLQFEGEAEYDYEMEEPHGSQSSNQSGFSAANSVRSQASEPFSYASINSRVSGHNPNIPPPRQHIRFPSL